MKYLKFVAENSSNPNGGDMEKSKYLQDIIIAQRLMGIWRRGLLSDVGSLTQILFTYISLHLRKCPLYPAIGHYTLVTNKLLYTILI